MKNKDELRNELRELSPFLLKQKEKQEGFKVPKDYFKSLPDEVLQKVRKQELPATPAPGINWLDEVSAMIQRIFQPRYALALASAAIVIIAGLYLLNQNDPASATAPLLADIPGEAIENYVSENIEDFDSDLFEAELAGINLEALPELELEEMEEYLLDELDDIDLDDLEDML